MEKLIKYFETQSIALKPYCVWFLAISIIIFLSLIAMLASLRGNEGIPTWAFFIAVSFMPIVVWSWGLLLLVTWYRPNRKKQPKIFEYYQAIFLIVFFFFPAFSIIWLF